MAGQAAATCFAVPVLRDNYAWVMLSADNRAVVIDPGEAGPIVKALEQRGATLEAILATHHHHDHVGGIAELVQACGGDPEREVEVWGSAYDVAKQRIPRASHAARDDVAFTLAGFSFLPLAVPGHTLGAMAFWCAEQELVFTGDTLFLAGCGRLFEGDAAQMWASLQRLRALPSATRVCCGHDYVAKNLRFARTLLPAADCAASDGAPQAAGSALPADGRGAHASRGDAPCQPWASMACERLRNPFLRADATALQTSLRLADATAVFAELRRRRDSFC